MQEKTNGAGADKKKANLMGTFAGVFTPSFLTIIGIIFFMRLGYVVGNAGLARALVIILIANGISILTSLSMAAVATNIRVKVGGVYYIISRTLGAQYGGAIGIVLYLAQAVSVAFYCIGFGEVLSALFPGAPALLPQIIATVALSVLFWMAWKGADWATRFQFVVMGVLVCAIISFFVGAALQWQPQTIRQNWLPFDGGTELLDTVRHIFPGGHRLYPGRQYVGRPARFRQKHSTGNLSRGRADDGAVFRRGGCVCRPEYRKRYWQRITRP